MQTIERDPRVDSQTAAVAGSEARSRTPLNDRIAARRTEDQRADSRLNSGFPLLAPGHNQPVIRTETWSLSTRDDQVGGAVICFAVTALTLPLAVILNPGLLWVWVFVGPVLLVAGIAQLINPYEVKIVPSGALRFISVTKTDEFSCAEVRRIVRQETGATTRSGSSGSSRWTSSHRPRRQS